MARNSVERQTRGLQVLEGELSALAATVESAKAVQAQQQAAVDAARQAAEASGYDPELDELLQSVAQPRHVHVHDAQVPRLGQHGRNGEQPQRREDRLPRYESHGMLEAPECQGRLRGDEKNVHDDIPQQLSKAAHGASEPSAAPTLSKGAIASKLPAAGQNFQRGLESCDRWSRPCAMIWTEDRDHRSRLYSRI